jgi:outer membrane protein TolC
MDREPLVRAGPCVTGLCITGLCIAGLCIAALVLPACRSSVEEPVLAAPWPEERAAAPLTHEDCVELALHNVPTAAAWTARLETARATFERNSSYANPTMSLAWEDFGLNAKAAGSPVQTTLSLAVALEDVFSHGRRKAAASHDLEAEKAALLAERDRLAAAVTHAYDDLASARARVAALVDLAELARTERAAVEEFVVAGVLPRIESDRAEAELEAALLEVDRARAEEHASELEFAFSLGFAAPVPLQLADPVTATTRAASLDLAQLLESAVRGREEIAAATARYQAELERAHLASERVQFLPTVSGGPRTQDGELRGVAGIDVVLPLFDAGSIGERLELAALLGAAAELRRTTHAVAGEVSAAAFRVESSEKLLRSALAIAEHRGVIREHAARLFQAGEIEFVELMRARRDEVDSRLALLEARKGAASARVDLDAAVGAAYVGTLAPPPEQPGR